MRRNTKGRRPSPRKKMSRRSKENGWRYATRCGSWTVTVQCRQSSWQQRGTSGRQRRKGGEQSSSHTRCRNGSGGPRPSCGRRRARRRCVGGSWLTTLPKRQRGRLSSRRGLRSTQQGQRGRRKHSTNSDAKEGCLDPKAQKGRRASRSREYGTWCRPLRLFSITWAAQRHPWRTCARSCRQWPPL